MECGKWCLKSCSVVSGYSDDGIGHLDFKHKNTCPLLNSGKENGAAVSGRSTTTVECKSLARNRAGLMPEVPEF